MRYRLFFKCRNCNIKFYEDFEWEEEDLMDPDNLSVLKLEHNLSVLKLGNYLQKHIHKCEEDTEGIGELVGMRRVKAE